MKWKRKKSLFFVCGLVTVPSLVFVFKVSPHPFRWVRVDIQGMVGRDKLAYKNALARAIAGIR